MRILVNMARLLYPTNTGGRIRSSKLLERLRREHEITIACFRQGDETDEQVERMRACCARVETVRWTESPKFSAGFYYELAANMVSRYPYVVQKYASRQMEQLISKLLDGSKYDLLLCDFLQPSLNVLNSGFRPRVLFQHNVESVIVQRHHQQASNPAAKLYFYLQWRKLFAYERRAATQFDHCIMVSEEDCRTMEELYGAQHTSGIPTGVDVDYFRPGNGEDTSENGIVFTGAMDWLPNEDAVLWFAKEVLPRIRSRVNARLWIVGRHPRDVVKRLKSEEDGIEVTGMVDDVRPYIDRAKVYVVPLRIGGGTRIKIYEAMAMGKPVVSTRVGAEGLPVVNGENVVLADDADTFAKHVADLLEDADARSRIGSAARTYVEENCAWDVAARRFSEICENVVHTWREAAKHTQ